MRRLSERTALPSYANAVFTAVAAPHRRRRRRRALESRPQHSLLRSKIVSSEWSDELRQRDRLRRRAASVKVRPSRAPRDGERLAGERRASGDLRATLSASDGPGKGGTSRRDGRPDPDLAGAVGHRASAGTMGHWVQAL